MPGIGFRHVRRRLMPARRIVINGVEQIDPRQTRRWRKLRDRVVREEPICQLQLPGICTLVSTTADHIKPVIGFPGLAFIRANHRGACQPCNLARRNLPDEALRLGANEPDPPALDVFGD